MGIFINLSKRINILVKIDRTNYKNSLNIIKIDKKYTKEYKDSIELAIKPMRDLKQIHKFNEKSEKLLI